MSQIPNTFVRKYAHFEKKSQIAPNAIIFNSHMSDAAVRLILALNGFPETWIARQSDIQHRLGWGKEKMRNTIKECVKLGYLRVKQKRLNESDQREISKKGQFSYNIFEFDTSPNFNQKCSHNECEPRRVNPPTANPHTVNQALLSSFSENTYEEEQQLLDKGSCERKKESSSCSSEDDARKEEFLESIRKSGTHISHKNFLLAMTLTLEELKNCIRAFHQYIENKKDLRNPDGCLYKAFKEKWTPTLTKKDIEKIQEDIKIKNNLILEEREFLIKKIIINSYLKDGHYMSINGNILYFKQPKGGYCISLQDPDCVKYVKEFVRSFSNAEL